VGVYGTSMFLHDRIEQGVTSFGQPVLLGVALHLGFVQTFDSLLLVGTMTLT